MNVTLILYESTYGIGEIVANIICPVLGPAKSFDINNTPQNIKYYSNIVLILSLYEPNSCEKILKYIENNKHEFNKKRVAIVCIGLSKEDCVNKINQIKDILNKEDAFSQFIKGEIFDDDEILKLEKDMRAYFNTPQFIPPANVTKKEIEDYLINKNTCTLATGYGDFVRATPIEYTYHDDNIYIISEGGLKFIGLSKNNKVSLCVYEDYKNMNNLCGLQISGDAEILKPWSDEYMDVLNRKDLKIENISKLPFDMNVIKIIPTKYEFLYSKFKNLGFNSKQIYIPKK